MDSMKNFYVWDSETKGNTCTLTPVQGFEKTYRLSKGISLADKFPGDVYFKMNPDFPKKVGLADNLFNLDSLVVVSIRLKEFLESKKLKNMEYLPVAIKNHKGRVASKDYFIVNPVMPQDCLDIEKSEPIYSRIKPDKISEVEQTVIDPERVDSEVALFGIKNFEGFAIIREELAEEISDGGFTGIYWEDPLEYTG